MTDVPVPPELTESEEIEGAVRTLGVNVSFAMKASTEDEFNVVWYALLGAIGKLLACVAPVMYALPEESSLISKAPLP
jgi:hypothetical protein